MKQEQKHVTDLREWFTERMLTGDIVEGLWLITDDDKKELVIKFNGKLSRAERLIYLQIVTKNLINTAVEEDTEAGGKSAFGDLMDGMQLREWNAENEETIRNGIPHEFGEV